jgi:Leucine-rich repeat (LRR) protein
MTKLYPDLFKSVKLYLGTQNCDDRIIINNKYAYIVKYNNINKSYILDRFISSTCDDVILTNIKSGYIQIQYTKNNILTQVGNITYIYTDNNTDDVQWFRKLPDFITPNLLKTRLNDVKHVTICGEDYNVETTTKLEIFEGELTECPDSIEQFSNLTQLKLNGNYLTTLPDFIGNLINLTYLNLGHNHLKQLPNSIGQLINLKSLDIRYNKLTELPDYIGQLINLTSLDANINKLTKLPDSIGQLTNLTHLCVGRNKLIELPDITQLTKLEMLGVHENRLTKLSDSITQFTKLKDLDISNNQLTHLPDNINKLTLNSTSIRGNLWEDGTYIVQNNSSARGVSYKITFGNWKKINKLQKENEKQKQQIEILTNDNLILTSDNTKLQNNIINLTNKLAQYDGDIATILNDL